MKIKYLKCNNCSDLVFSFHRHDYQLCGCRKLSGDGGYSVNSEAYMRIIGSDYSIEENEIKILIPYIREKFTYGKNYNEKNKRLPETEYVLLEDLTSEHLCRILSYFTNKLANDQISFIGSGKEFEIPEHWFKLHLIFIEELKYRIEILKLI